MTLDRPAVDVRPDDVGVRPFTPRSLVLSVLLGLPEAEMPRTAAGRLGDLFDIPAGTMRTALSRMSSRGEIAGVDGRYELRGRLLERKAAQDAGRRPPPTEWDGEWWVVSVIATNRTVTERRNFRARMVNGRMGELRPETWLRPANIDGPTEHDDSDSRSNGQTMVAVRGALALGDPSEMVSRLWDLDAIVTRGRWLLDRLATATPAPTVSPSKIPDAMVLSAAVLRFLRQEPLLPPALTPPAWPVDELRMRYRGFDHHVGSALRRALGM